MLPPSACSKSGMGSKAGDYLSSTDQDTYSIKHGPIKFFFNFPFIIPVWKFIVGSCHQGAPRYLSH